MSAVRAKRGSPTQLASSARGKDPTVSNSFATHFRSSPQTGVPCGVAPVVAAPRGLSPLQNELVCRPWRSCGKRPSQLFHPAQECGGRFHARPPHLHPTGRRIMETRRRLQRGPRAARTDDGSREHHGAIRHVSHASASRQRFPGPAH